MKFEKYLFSDDATLVGDDEHLPLLQLSRGHSQSRSRSYNKWCPRAFVVITICLGRSFISAYMTKDSSSDHAEVVVAYFIAVIGMYISNYEATLTRIKVFVKQVPDQPALRQRLL